MCPYIRSVRGVFDEGGWRVVRIGAERMQQRGYEQCKGTHGGGNGSEPCESMLRAHKSLCSLLLSYLHISQLTVQPEPARAPVATLGIILRLSPLA
jgi:hypothetical protein